MTPSGLGLDTASPTQGFGDIIPDGTQVVLVMKIKPGNTGIESLLKRTSKGDAEMLDCEFVVQGGPFDKRKIFRNLLLDGTTAGQAKACEISRAFLRAEFEAVHGIDPNDTSPATTARRANATLAGFHGATFIAVVGVEKGGKKADGSNYPDKNTIAKVLRPGDAGYRRLDQPPPQPIERSTPPAPTPAPNGSQAVATTAIAKPAWAQE